MRPSRRLVATLAVAFAALAGDLALPGLAEAGASMRLRYDEASLGLNDGAWYKDSSNEDALLAWGESYVMASFVTMYRATGDLAYLHRLCEHADGVLAQRDSERGVVDYRGKSEPCWQATKYSTEPYCFAVHTGMIASPMVELAALVAADPSLADVVTYDGGTLGDKAASYLEAGEAAAAVHADEWRDAGADQGFYVFRSDMDFYPEAGKEVPLNMSNAMGLLHVALADATGSTEHADRASRLARHFKASLTLSSDGAYLWNYRAGAYQAPGEDVSHAALNVAFATRAYASAIVFVDDDLSRLARTFMGHAVVDSATSYDHVGGSGTQNGSSYRLQLGRWAVLAPIDPSIHAVVRDLYAGLETTTSGSLLLSMALLAATDRFVRPFEFYVADWADQGDRRQATAANANVTTEPLDTTVPVLVRLHYSATYRTPVQQWDGTTYHTVVTLAPTGGAMATAHVAYHPEYFFDYGGAGALFQFSGTFSDGKGIVILEPEPMEPPIITSKPPTDADVGETLTYAATATGETPLVWSIEAPASVALATGDVSFEATESAKVDLHLQVTNDYGADEQSWTVLVTDAETPGDGPGSSGGGALGKTGQADGSSSETNGGCGCRAARPPVGSPILFGVGLVLLSFRLRRRCTRPRRERASVIE